MTPYPARQPDFDPVIGVHEESEMSVRTIAKALTSTILAQVHPYPTASLKYRR